MKRRMIGLALTAIFSLGLPALADVKNLDYKVQEIEATGMGADADSAMRDAELQAIEQVVFTLVQTEAEKQAYEKFRPKLLATPERFVQRKKVLGKGTAEGGGRYYKLLLEVQVAALRDTLIEAKVIASTQELAQQLNYPSIMAYYSRPDDSSEYALWAVNRINSYLTSHAFKVVDPKVMFNLNKDDQVIAQSSGQANRKSQAIAIKAQADLYIQIAVKLTPAGTSGDYTFIQSPVEVQAFESSSGIPFITKTYQRLDKSGQPEALAVKGSVDISSKAVIEEAVAGVMPQVTQDLMQHWKQNVASGKQFVLVVNGLNPAKESVFEGALKQMCKQVGKKKAGEYVVRYQGVLGDLADALEEELESKIGLTTERFDLGFAFFKVK